MVENIEKVLQRGESLAGACAACIGLLTAACRREARQCAFGAARVISCSAAACVRLIANRTQVLLKSEDLREGSLLFKKGAVKCVRAATRV